MPNYYYGWRPSLPDRRDLKYHPPAHVLASLPPSVDNSPGLGPVLDQLQLGACGPNSCAGLLMYDQRRQGLPVVVPSRLFIYYCTRVLQGTVDQDSGVDNRTLLKAVAQYGFPPEPDWPYDIARFTQQPPQQAYDDAQQELVKDYAAVPQDLDAMRGALAAGKCFIFGFTVYQSFESSAVEQTGTVPMPGSGERVMGGHDILFYGYDDSTQRFKFRNSWSADWGAGGNGTMPYAYATDPGLSSDFWTINAIPGGTPPLPNPPPPSPPGPPPNPPSGAWAPTLADGLARVDKAFAALIAQEPRRYAGFLHQVGLDIDTLLRRQP